jgi:hypothetical protein
MKKWSLILWFAVIVGSALIFMGCPTESDESEAYSPEKAAAELAAVLGAGKATVSGATVTLIENVDIGATGTVTVGSGVTLDVAADKTLTVNGAIINNGEITVSGTFLIPDPTGDITSRGANNGKITVKSGGDLRSYGNAIEGEGETLVEAGGKVAWEKGNNDAPVYSAGPSDANSVRFVLSTATGNIKAGSLTYGNKFYIVDGGVSFNGTWGTEGYDLVDLDDESFTIKGTGVLTIPSGKSFRVKNEAANGQPTPPKRAIEGETGATIVVEGKLYIQDADTAVTLNFYDTSGTKVTTTAISQGSTVGSIPVGTYKWDAAAGGEGTAGWKKQAG